MSNTAPKRAIAARSASIEAARSAWASAEYDVAEELLAGSRDPESRLLLARTLMRQKRYTEVDGVLHRSEGFASLEARTTALILSASAAERCSVSEPKAVVEPEGASQSIRADILLHQAQSAFRRGDLASASASARKAQSIGGPQAKIIALDLRAWIEHAQKRPEKAIAFFSDAIRLLEKTDNRDEHRRANALQGLAFVALETLDTGLLEVLEKSVASLQITKWMARSYVSAVVSIAALNGLLGESTREYRALLSARAAQAEAELPGLADVHLAAFHRVRGSADAAKLHLSLAFEDLQRLDWPASDLEQRGVAVSFAAEAAILGDRRAGTLFTRAVSSTGRHDPMLVFEHNEHMSAGAYLARARLAEMREDVDSALADTRRALELWTAHGDQLQSVVAQIDLFRMEGGTRIPDGVARMTRRFPKSWLKSEADRLAKMARSPRLQVTEAEERVLSGICKGLTSKQIAETLGRSPSTVRVQTVSLFKKFGVTTRTALAAKAKEHG